MALTALQLQHTLLLVHGVLGEVHVAGHCGVDAVEAEWAGEVTVSPSPDRR